MNMPNSFNMGDQHALKVAAAAESEALASQKVCLLAFTHLLLRGAKAVLLRANHWNCAVTSIQQDATSISGTESPVPDSDFPLAPAPPPRSAHAEWYYEAPPPDQTTTRDNEICNILIQMIQHSNSDWVDPSHANNWQLLRRWLEPGTLKKFLESHSQFEIYNQGHGKRWWFGFAQSGDGGHNIGGSLPAIADTPNASSQ